ncbi:putative 31.1 kd protein in dcm-seru intergenic region [Escherichia coli MS 119-7]|nr:putative 31.1 kd protein in dcm-seru intergenic region [Escherichia coli MS 119-7]
MIAADERYLPTDNGKLFSTGNHPIETLLPLYHLHAAGFEFEVATISGLMTKFEYWAMPHKDEKVMPFFEQHKSLFRNPKKLADVVVSLNADSEYAAIFVPGGHGALIGLPESRTWLLLCSGQSKMTVLLSPFATARRLFWRFATAITH